MKRVIVIGGLVAVAAGIAAILVYPTPAATQSLPPASIVRVVETTYASVGVSTLGSNGSVAWFVETNSDKERNPIACAMVAGTVECKRGKFPQP